MNDLNANTSNGCGAIDTPLGAPPASIPLPFDDPALIQGWKDTAAAGGTITGDYTVPAFTTVSLGRKKITGNLLVDNGATLVVTGTLWVVGNIDVKNDADVHLDAGYGSTSGIIVAYLRALGRQEATLCIFQLALMQDRKRSPLKTMPRQIFCTPIIALS